MFDAMGSAALLTDIPPEAWSLGKDLGLGTLLGLALFMILTGRLIPRRIHDEIVDKVTEERDMWREVGRRATGQVDDLLPSAQITTEITRSLAAVGDEHSAAVEQAMYRRHPGNRGGRQSEGAQG